MLWPRIFKVSLWKAVNETDLKLKRGFSYQLCYDKIKVFSKYILLTAEAYMLHDFLTCFFNAASIKYYYSAI